MGVHLSENEYSISIRKRNTQFEEGGEEYLITLCSEIPIRLVSIENRRMKTPLLALICLLTGSISVSFAQSWAPLSSDTRYHYLSPQDSFVHTIWVDSSHVGDADTFFLNRRFVACEFCVSPNDYFLGLKMDYPHFLMKEWQVYGDSLWVLTDTNSFQIYPRASVGESWVFVQNAAASIQATVTHIVPSTSWGVADSLKVISLSNGTEIRLSQQFGILTFPDFSQPGLTFTLIGVENPSNTFGLEMPAFRDYYAYEIGDEVERRYYFRSFRGLEESPRSEQIKWRIMDKKTSGDSLIYSVEWIQQTVSYHWYSLEPKHTYVTQETREMVYVDSASHPLNGYSYELRPYNGDSNIVDCSSSGGMAAYMGTFLKLGADSVIRHYLGRDMYVELNAKDGGFFRPWNDSLFKRACADDYWEIYTPSIGGLLGRMNYFETSAEYDLVGAVIRGDTIGTPSPDSVLTSLDQVDIEASFLIYPNPASQVLYAKWDFPNRATPSTLTFLTAQGQVLFQQSLDSPQADITLDVRSYAPGLYLLKIEGGYNSVEKIRIE